jgi:aminoglycoside phosphotransferase family enzyme/predicted kinase
VDARPKAGHDREEPNRHTGIMTQDQQNAVIDFLADPATHGGAPVKRIDTHAATVFLDPGRALKIKRVVRFPFLDYTTLAKRKAACEAEIEVNRPFAPAIYKGVVAITRTAGGSLAIGGDGEPVEWAVEMARFDERQTIDHLAEAGRIDDKLADDLGRAVARAHAAGHEARDAGFFPTLSEIAAQNEAELFATPELFAQPQVSALAEATRAALVRARPLLEKRERLGQVRRCHGDLHLGNIVLIDGAPVLFDAIEFDPKLSTIDVFYDLAFLLMDLIDRGLTSAANIVLNRYLTERQIENKDDRDLDALMLLPLFMSLRAAIRAKVTAARPKRDRVIEASARDYFALALKLLLPPPPQLIAVGGLSGTGKSLLARALAPSIAPSPGAVILRSDVTRKALFGKAETERLPAEAYTKEVTARVYAALADKARRVLAAGHSAIADAVFAEADERRTIAQAAADRPFHGLFLTADLEARLARVGARKGDASDADAAIARAQERYVLGALDWREVDASGTPAQTLQRGRKALDLTD